MDFNLDDQQQPHFEENPEEQMQDPAEGQQGTHTLKPHNSMWYFYTVSINIQNLHLAFLHCR